MVDGWRQRCSLIVDVESLGAGLVPDLLKYSAVDDLNRHRCFGLAIPSWRRNCDRVHVHVRILGSFAVRMGVENASIRCINPQIIKGAIGKNRMVHLLESNGVCVAC